MRKIFTLLLLACLLGPLHAQSTAYVINAGPTLGIQKWENDGAWQTRMAGSQSTAMGRC